MVEDFPYAMSELMEAIAERDEARGNCDSSWDYFGQRHEKRVEDAAKEIEKILRRLIVDVIKEQAAK